jgi:glycyl-tRNA synthetase
VPSAAAYSSLLQQQSIQLDLDARRKAIWEAATAAAAEVGVRSHRPAAVVPRVTRTTHHNGVPHGRLCVLQVGGVIPESASGDLLDEVSNLVESPSVIRGAFDPAFLELPE